jgi:hypothetical protein
MPQQQPIRRRRNWILFAAIGAVVLFLAVGTGVAGCLFYLQWSFSRPARVDLSVTPPQGSEPPGGYATAPPPVSSDAELRDWARLTETEANQPPTPQPQRQHNTDELIAAMDKAFAEPAADVKPAVVFFPFVDAAGKVRPDGFVLGKMAMFAAAYTPRRRLEISIPHHEDELMVAGCQKAGTSIDAKKIALCTAAMSAKLYVIPRLETADGKQELIVEFHGDGKAIPDRTFRHEIAADQLCRTPGLAAKDVLEAVGATLDDAESSEVLTPTVRNDHELSNLITLLNRYPAGASEGNWLANFLNVNRGCILAWDEYLLHGHKADWTPRLMHLHLIKPSCDRLEIEANRLLRDSGHAEESLLALLKLAPSHHGDSGYYATLSRCAVLLDDEKLFDHVFDLWEKAGPGYAGYLARGAELMQWGWKARGGDVASRVTKKGWKLFQERLNQAQSELESAVDINPTGCRAHTDLMTVARGLSLPAAYMERHFREAIRARPNLYMAYAQKYQYLLPRWNGNNEKLLAFGKEYLETHAWSDRVPDLCLSAINEVRSGMSDDDLAGAMKQGPLWDALRAYDEAVEKEAGPAAQDYARNVFARLGVVGGHFDDVLPAYQKLEEKQSPDLDVFVDLAEYEYFRDLVQANTGKLSPLFHGRKRGQALARASTALANAELDEAEKALKEVAPGDAEQDRLVARYRGALALGRKLDADGSATLSPQQVKDVCVVQDKSVWSVEGDKLVGRKLFGEVTLELPLGLQHAMVSGVVEWSGGVGAVEMQLHARSPRTKERILFYPQQGQVTFQRDGKTLASDVLRPGSQQFQLAFGAKAELLQPTLGVLWPVPADDLPGCLTMNLWANNNNSTWTLSDLRIEVKK